MKKIYKLFILLVLFELNAGGLWAQNNFTTLQGLINNTPNGGTLTLSADYTAASGESRLSISGKSIILDLNGHIIDRNHITGSVIHVASGAVLTIKDSNSTAVHSPAVTYPDVQSPSTIITVNGGIIMGGSSDGSGGGIAADASSVVKLQGGTITKNSAHVHGGGIFSEGSVEIDGGEVSGNESVMNGGGVYIYNSDHLILNNGKISNNSADIMGGGVFAWIVNSVSMTNSIVTRNVSKHQGGGMSISNGTHFTMNSGEISWNKAEATPNGQGEFDSNGGGVFLNENSSFEMIDGIITHNNSCWGGGVYDGVGCTFTMYGGEISYNTAWSEGGVAVSNGGVFTMHDGLIKDNKDGAVVINTGTFTMKGGNITDNNLTSSNNNSYPAVFIIIRENALLSSSVFNMEGGTISDNRTGAVRNHGTFNMTGGTITGNLIPEPNQGKGVYQDGIFNLSGSVTFGSDDDIYLNCTKTSSSGSGNNRVITKAGDITSGTIPVTVGYSSRANLYDGRNLIESGTSTVTDSDYSKFTFVNQSAYNDLLVIDRYTAQDEGTGNPVIELHDLAACWEGSGTSTDPYRIVDDADLVCLATEVNAGTDYAGIYFQMTQDIDLSSVCGESIGNWTPIGRPSTPFKGSFDGGNHTITGLYINGLDNYQGLFGFIDDGAQVNNLTLGASTICGKTFVGLVGYMNVNTGNTIPSINNCTTLSSVNVTGNKMVGGICGWSHGSFSYCINNATIVGNMEVANPDDFIELPCVGGIVGYCNPYDYRNDLATGAYAVSMTNCTNNGSVTADVFTANEDTHYAIAVGGIGGLLEGVVLTNCTNTAAVTGTAVVGGISGGTDGNVVYPSKFIQCNNSGAVTGSAIVGGISGDNDGTTNESVYDDCHNTGALSSHFCAGGIIGRYNTDLGYNKGETVITSPVIQNCSNSGDVVLEDGAFTMSGSPVQWIGNAGGIAGMLTDVDIENCTNTGDVTGNTGYAGGIVAESERIHVSHCHNEGNVQITDDHEPTMNDLLSFSTAAAGLVGMTYHSTITSSYNTGNVNGGVFAAGIVGFMYSNVEAVSKCFNLGVVESNTKMGLAGGIVGDFSVGDGVLQTAIGINNCYNAGPLIGHGAAGGIAAFSETNVKDCYNVGYVTAIEGGAQGLTFNECAGIVGTFNHDNGIDPEIINCYYDKQMCPVEYDYTTIDLSTFTFTPHTADGDNLLTTAMVGSAMNSILDASTWTFAEGLYPQLTTYAASSNVTDVEASLVSATPMFLKRNETVDQVMTSPFTVGVPTNLEWIHVAGDNLLTVNNTEVTWSEYGTETVAVRHTTDTQIQKLIKVTTTPAPTGDTWVDVVVAEPEGYNDNDINSPEDLAWFCSRVNGFNGEAPLPYLHGTITADIDLSAHYWVPIGLYAENINSSLRYSYNSSFNGNHYNIDGVNIDFSALTASPVVNPSGSKETNAEGNRSYGDYLGFFGKLGPAAYIEDVVVVSGTIVGADNHSQEMGGIAGCLEGGIIRACVSNVKMTHHRHDSKGGIVGECEGSYEGGKEHPEGELKIARVLNCTSTAEMVGYGCMGGIAGAAENAIISNCYANAKFTVQPSGSKEDSYDSYVGGIVGGCYESELSNCYVRLREDSNYGLSKDRASEEHFFGLFIGEAQSETVKHCYAPENTGYRYIGWVDSDSYMYVKATRLSDVNPSQSKGDVRNMFIATQQSEGNYYLMPFTTPFNVSSTVQSSAYESSEILPEEQYNNVPAWELEGYLDGQGYYIHYDGNYLKYDSDHGTIALESNGGGNMYWNVEQFGNEATFKMSSRAYPDICLALHDNGDGTYTFGAYNYNTYGSIPEYNFHICFFMETEIPSDGNLYGCGTYSPAVYPYTYSDPRGGSVVTLDNADEDDYATSCETTLLDALNNWVVGNYVGTPELFNTYAPDPDWARFGSPLNGDYPVHCYYDPDNIKPASQGGGDENSPTAKVIVTTDKTKGYPFRYYHHVSDALTYCNDLTGGGIVCVYGSDDMRGPDNTQENDADVDVYVNGMTYMQCQKLKTGAPYSYYTFFGDNAAAKSTDWYVSLLQDEGKSLTVTTGFNLDNSDATDFAGANYDWHMVSSPLQALPVGISYPDQDQHDLNNLPECGWDANADGLFPDDTPYNRFDFYAYSEPYYHWMNFKRNSASHWFQDTGEHIDGYENDQILVPGHGYLIAMDKELFMQAKGELNNGDVEVGVTYSGYHNKGLNYLGNPYQSSLDFDAFVTENESLWANPGDDVNLEYNQSYLILDADAHCYKYYAQDQSNNPEQLSRYIWPFQGFYVGVYNPGTATFTNDMRVIGVNRASYMRDSESDRNDYPLVNLKVTDAEDKSDMFTVELDRPEWGGSRKEKGMTAGSGMLWSSREDKEYSILFSGEGVDEIPVRFSAKKAGAFTMTWSHYNGEFTYLHLIDNMTGVDIDCLTTESYTFEGKSDDYQSRFRLVFSMSGEDDDDDDTTEAETFAFQTGDGIVVNGAGMLQMFDVNGRCLMGTELYGQQNTISLPTTAAGVYVLRLTSGENVKVQKMVVR